MTSPATSLNIDEEVRKLSHQLCENAFDQSKSAGLCINHFGTTVKNSIGRAYYGLCQTLSILIETRGIGAGRYCFDRRVFAQTKVVTAYLQSVAKHASAIKETVANARQPQNQSAVVVLQQGASGETIAPYFGMERLYTMDGTMARDERQALLLEDQIIRQRSKPEGYLISSSLLNLPKILAKAENMGITFEVLPIGTRLNVQQYQYLGKRADGETEDDILADLMPQREIVFDEETYYFTTDQPMAMVLCMLMEPDVTDSAGTRGTLYQQGLLTWEEIYRVV